MTSLLAPLLAVLSAGPALPAPAGPGPTGSVAATTAAASMTADTVVEARRGDRLVLQNVSGRIRVRAVEGNRVRLVTASRTDDGSVRLTRSGDRLRLSDRDPKGRSRDRDLELEVPSWLRLDLRANELDATVEGLRADVSIRNVDGDLTVVDVEGAVDLWSVDGEVRVRDVRGRVTARSVDESVEVSRTSGEVEVGSTDGDLLLREVDGTRVDAQTVDGDVVFDGPLRPGGSYSLATHGGDVTVLVQEGVGARVEVSTFDGTFEADFPVTLERFRGGREMSFTLGDGSARLVVQAFDGDIRLRHR